MRVIRLDVPAEELADLRLAMVNGDPEVRVAQFADLRDPDRPPTAAASAGAVRRRPVPCAMPPSGRHRCSTGLPTSPRAIGGQRHAHR
jgi:hypothetical protein